MLYNTTLFYSNATSIIQQTATSSAYCMQHVAHCNMRWKQALTRVAPCCIQHVLPTQNTTNIFPQAATVLSTTLNEEDVFIFRLLRKQHTLYRTQDLPNRKPTFYQLSYGHSLLQFCLTHSRLSID